MVYWVVLRDFETGRLTDFWTFSDAKDAERKRYHLQENQTIQDCRIEVEILWHPEKPKEFNLG
jgi:hypothetical protein